MPGNAIVAFPAGLILDENGNPNIDIDHTRQSRNPVDIKIPLDKKAALKTLLINQKSFQCGIAFLRQTVYNIY